MIAKILTLAVWIVIIASTQITMPFSASEWLPTLGLALLVAHALEAVFFTIKLSHRSSNLVLDLILIMIFGLFHWAPMLKANVAEKTE